ncbi:predicted protein [Sclerotinia sclerotiorum 1980 UF-70]|uniref:Uncharacterized protein n=1 Tax=Sclerotinia sclerotiorum (strain ATCC 18683 / 1980 / Ss-1) TaxID=665079 RepID=A7ER88_SCLS1|nr:predicted protein [Sclerotinia sclerotiorum 1980 UF-70]EDN91980.1 predicted protein [Sclerotinia sclerotiorum 1980 UF-70]
MIIFAMHLKDQLKLWLISEVESAFRVSLSDPSEGMHWPCSAQR